MKVVPLNPLPLFSSPLSLQTHHLNLCCIMSGQDIRPLQGWKEASWSFLAGQGDKCDCERQWCGAVHQIEIHFRLWLSLHRWSRQTFCSQDFCQSTADNFITDLWINVALCSLNTALVNLQPNWLAFVPSIVHKGSF